MLDNNGVHPITYTAKTAQKAYKEAEQAFKFELEEPQKVVDYFGIKLVVPNDHMYITTDADGQVCAFTSKPEIDDDAWYDRYIVQNNSAELCVIKSMPNPNWWKGSLIEV